MLDISRLASTASLIALASVAPLANAQTADNSPADGAVVDTANSDDDYHGVIFVTAPGIDRLDILAGSEVLRGEDLARNQKGQLGEVVESLPGVSATGFAPGASRPILRGSQGERVKVLIDGIGAIDASNTSADHAVSIDTLTAESIEVLR